MAEKAKRIILANLDLEQVLIELAESGSSDDECERAGSLLEGHGYEITDFIATQADHLGVPQSILATQMIAKRVKKAGSLLACEPMIAFGCFLLNKLLLDTDYLLELVLKDLNNCSIVSIWKLHQAAILPLEKILTRISQNKKQASFQNYLTAELISLSPSPAPSYQKPLMRDVTRFLILGSSDESSGARVCKEILLQTILRSYSHDNAPEYTILNAVEEISTELSSDAVDWMCQSVMRTLSTAPVISSAPSAFSIQHKCSSSAQPAHTSIMFTKIASLLGPVEGLKIIRNALEYHELNWVTVLSYEVCFLHCHKESSKHLRGMITQLCSEALADRNEHLLSFAMLLAQQASLEGTHIFPSYAEWIREMFGNSQNTLIQAKTQLQFLLKCLTQLIPHHTPECLRSHFRHPPRQLAKCLGDIADYTSLVKARLQELNEPLPVHGSSSSSNGGRSGEFAQAGDDVEKMLEDFQQSDCTTVPTKLLEMSIFRKPYFTERFLRSLLAPRQPPSVPDAREKLITMLSRREKIPNKMLATYRKECQKYQDNAQSPVVSQSLQQILPILEKIVENYTSNKLATYFSRLSSALASLSIRAEMSDGLSLYSPGLTEGEVELMNLLLERIIKSVVNVCTHLSKTTTDQVSVRFDVVSMFVRMLEGHPNLHWPLLIRLWELLHIQSSKLSLSHLLGLAILLAKLFTVSANYRAVQFTSCCMNAGPPVLHTLQSSSEYAVFLLGSMTHCSTHDMLAVVRLLTQFFQHLLTTESQSILSKSQLQSPLMKLSYLTKRLTEASYSTDSSSPSKQKLTAVLKWAKEIREKTQGLQSLYSSAQIDLEQWMHWEYIGVDPTTDMLSGLMRQQYRRETFYQLAAGNTAHSINRLLSCLVQLQLIQERVGAICKEHNSCINRLAAVNWRDGIQLMTEITAGLPPSSGGGSPRLVAAVTNLLKPTAAGSLVSSCVSTCLSLPPYLLFTDHLSSTPCQDSLINTAQFLRNCLFPACVHYVLPIAVTHHILKGLLQCPGSYRCSELFVQSSSLFLASLLRWWSHLKESVGRQLCKPVLHLVEELAAGGQCSKADHLGPVTVKLYCDLVSRDLDKERILETMIPANDKMCLLLMDCCVRELCSNPIWLDDEGKLSSQLLIAKHTLSKCHMVWSVFDDKPNQGHTSVLLANFRKEFPVLHNIQLLPLALFKVLAKLERPFLLKLCRTQTGFVSFCHQAHQQCLLLRGSDDTISPLSLNFIRQMSSLIQIISTN